MSQLVQSVVFVTVAHRATDPEAALAVVNGEVLLAHTVRGLLGTPEIDLVAVVAPERCAAVFLTALAGFSATPAGFSPALAGSPEAPAASSADVAGSPQTPAASSGNVAGSPKTPAGFSADVAEPPAAMSTGPAARPEAPAGLPEAVAGPPGRCRVVPGPSLRQAFAAVEPGLSPDAVVLVHDALRAFTPQGTIRDVLGAVRARAGAVVPVLPMADTVKSTGEARLITGTVDRDGLRTAQTPVGFPLPEFRATLDADDALDAAVRAGAATVPGHPDAMRVASPFELTLAEALVALHGHEEPL